MTNALFDQLVGNQSTNWVAYYQELIEEALQPSSPFEQKPTPHLLKDYVGTYIHPAYGEITIVEEEGKLVAQFRHLSMPLFHCQYDIFEGRLEGLVNVNFPLQFIIVK